MRHNRPRRHLNIHGQICVVILHLLLLPSRLSSSSSSRSRSSSSSSRSSSSISSSSISSSSISSSSISSSISSSRNRHSCMSARCYGRVRRWQILLEPSTAISSSRRSNTSYHGGIITAITVSGCSLAGTALRVLIRELSPATTALFQNATDHYAKHRDGHDEDKKFVSWFQHVGLL
jgi:hypothetical protein